MKIKKVVNNNIVIAVNENGQESVLTGKGIAFAKKTGETIDHLKVEKTFLLKQKGIAEKLSHLIQDIPIDYIKVSDEIINNARKEIGIVKEEIYLTLIDHISFAIERFENGVILGSTLKTEMQLLYPKEYEVGLKALDIIDERLGIRFPNDEAAYIAFHFVNAGTGNINVLENLGFVQEIVKIIKEYFQIELKTESIEYSRLLTHLKYFSYRVFHVNDEMGDINKAYMYEKFRIDLPEESKCAEKIAKYIKEHYHYDVKDDEKEYLIIHLHRILARL